MNMYDAFDGFLRVDTWHTQHRLDEERFFRALRTVVERNDFNPDALGTYIDEKRAEREFRLTDLSEEQYETARAYYVAAARAVFTYLRTAERCELGD